MVLPLFLKESGVSAEFDVLCGRGGAGINTNPGNIQFRTWVEIFRNDYVNSIKTDKVKISARVVAMVQELGGKYVTLEEETQKWEEISDIKCLEKTSQALREIPKGPQSTDKFRADPKMTKLFTKRFYRLWNCKRVLKRAQKLLKCRASTASLTIEPSEPFQHLDMDRGYPSNTRSTSNSSKRGTAAKKRKRSYDDNDNDELGDHEDDDDDSASSLPLNSKRRRHRHRHDKKKNRKKDKRGPSASAVPQVLTTNLSNKRIRVTTLNLEDSFDSSSSSSSAATSASSDEEMEEAESHPPVAAGAAASAFLDTTPENQDEDDKVELVPEKVNSNEEESPVLLVNKKKEKKRPSKFLPSKIRRADVRLDRKQSLRPLYDEYRYRTSRRRQEEALSKRLFQASHDLDELVAMGMVAPERPPRQDAWNNRPRRDRTAAARTTDFLFLDEQQQQQQQQQPDDSSSYLLLLGGGGGVKSSKPHYDSKRRIFGPGQPILFGGAIPMRPPPPPPPAAAAAGSPSLQTSPACNKTE